MDSSTRFKIKELILDTAIRTLKRVASAQTVNPFFDAMLSAEVIRYSRFERSFSTSWGQRAVEEMARMIAVSAKRRAQRPRDTVLSNVSDRQINAVSEIIDSLRNRVEPDWYSEIALVHSTQGSPVTSPATVRSDLWVSDVGGSGSGAYFSIKTAMPNIDQTAVAKSDMLRLQANDRGCEVYFALPYNPYGANRLDYAFKPPFTIFDMHRDDCVLIGSDFWDYLGGEGTFAEIIEICVEVGPEIRRRIADV